MMAEDARDTPVGVQRGEESKKERGPEQVGAYG